MGGASPARRDHIEFNRFGTTHVAGVQVANGLSSIGYGTPAMSGAINVVSRKPRRALDGDVSTGIGGNLTLMSQKCRSGPNLRNLGLPDRKLFLFALVQPMRSIEFQARLENNGS